jgi:putative Holliday junction resolvase
MKILGIDFGTKDIGLAIGDTKTGMVAPLQSFHFHSLENALDTIKKVVDGIEASKIVIGLPLSFGFKETRASEAARAFGQELQNSLSLQVDYENEILTSRLAARHLGYKSRRKRESQNHSFSACLILESYLTRVKHEKSETQNSKS